MLVCRMLYLHFCAKSRVRPGGPNAPLACLDIVDLNMSREMMRTAFLSIPIAT